MRRSRKPRRPGSEAEEKNSDHKIKRNVMMAKIKETSGASADEDVE